MDLNADSTGVYFTTGNDGFYTFTAQDLSVLDPMTYQIMIVLVSEIKQPIFQAGYDPRGFIRGRILGTQILYLQ